MNFLSILILSLLLALMLPDAGRAEMVYLHQEGERRQVALADDQGEDVRLLTPEDRQAYHPEISADGRYVAYSIGTIQPDTVEVAIEVLDRKTGDIEVWTPAGNQFIHAEFSGDGEVLAFSGPVGTKGAVRQQIHLVHLPSARKEGAVRVEEKNGRVYRFFDPKPEIIEDEANAYFPALASDGSFVVYHRTQGEASHESPKELVLYDRREKTRTLLTEKGGHAMVPSLSWDNRYLTYAAVRDGQWDIRLLDLWTKEDRQITDSPTKEFTPVFAPDDSITFTRIGEGEDAPRIDLYRLPREQVFGDAPADPAPFIADPQVAEYVPAFSGMVRFSLEQLPPFPDPPRSSFGYVAHGGKIYIAGGHQGPEHTYPPESFLDRLDIYDPQSQSWTQGASLSVPRHGFEMIAHEDSLYAFGGFAYSEEHSPSWKSLDIIERYDIAEDRWEVLPERLPQPRSSNVAAHLGEKVYLIGGWDSTPRHPGDKEGQFLRTIEVFDLKTEKVSTSSHRIPDPLRRAFTAVVHDEEIILLGGITEGATHFDWLDKASVFTPATGQWRELPPLPFATFAPGAGIYEKKLFLFGGMNPERQYQNTIFALDLSTPEDWLNTGRYLEENKGFPMVVEHPRGGLGVLGGHTYRYEDGEKTDSPVSTFEWWK